MNAKTIVFLIKHGRNMSHVMRKPVKPYSNNKGADQPAHPCNLISAFVVRGLDSVIPLVSMSKISSLYLTSVAAQAGFCLTWSETPKTGFLVTRLISLYHFIEPEHDKPNKKAYAPSEDSV